MFNFFENPELRMKHIEEKHHQVILELADFLENESVAHLKRAASQLREIVRLLKAGKDLDSHITDKIEPELVGHVMAVLKHDFKHDKRFILQISELDQEISHELGPIAEKVRGLEQLLRERVGEFHSQSSRIERIIVSLKEIKTDEGLYSLIRTEILALLCDELSVKDQNAKEAEFAEQIMKILHIEEIFVPTGRGVRLDPDIMIPSGEESVPALSSGEIVKVAARGIKYKGEILDKARVITAL